MTIVIVYHHKLLRFQNTKLYLEHFFFLLSITCSRKENSVVRYAGSFINIFTVDLKVSEHSQVGSEQWMKSQSLGEDVVHKT